MKNEIIPTNNRKLNTKVNIIERDTKGNFLLSISKNFSRTPGGRFRREGPYSGEEFREDLLIPYFLKAKEERVKLVIDLDGCMGYPSSFIDESFGGLARQFSNKNVLDTLNFKSEDQPDLVEIICDVMKSGLKK